MTMRWNEDRDDEKIQVYLYKPYDQEIKSAEPIGPLLAEVERAIRAGEGADEYDVGTALDELRDIAPALECAHAQVRRQTPVPASPKTGSARVTVTIRVPSRHNYTLGTWASVGRTFDNVMNVLDDVGRADLVARVRAQKQIMDHLQKRIADAMYYGDAC